MCNCTSEILEIPGAAPNAPPWNDVFDQRHREPSRRLFAVIGDVYLNEMSGSKACAIAPIRRSVDVKFCPFCEERS
jgi:hypothetical protein